MAGSARGVARRRWGRRVRDAVVLSSAVLLMVLLWREQALLIEVSDRFAQWFVGLFLDG